MSQGAMNWPFLTLTILPVAAAATTRSVWRHRNAGICSTSATAAAASTWATSWTSVRIGTRWRPRTEARISRPFSMPGPR